MRKRRKVLKREEKRKDVPLAKLIRRWSLYRHE